MKKALFISFLSVSLSWLGNAQSGQRDPFMDLTARQISPVPQITSVTPTPRVQPEPRLARKITPDLPKIGVKGILTSPAGHRAILASPEHTVIVKQGDQLGAFRVASIDREGVTLESRQQRFRCVLEKL